MSRQLAYCRKQSHVNKNEIRVFLIVKINNIGSDYYRRLRTHSSQRIICFFGKKSKLNFRFLMMHLNLIFAIKFLNYFNKLIKQQKYSFYSHIKLTKSFCATTRYIAKF